MPPVIVLFIQNLISRRHQFRPFSALIKQCQLFEAYENEYRTAHEIANFKNARANDDDNGGYLFRLPLYILGARDAYILISANQNDNTNDSYEIGEFQLRSKSVLC